MMPPQFRLAATVMIWIVAAAVLIMMLIAQGTAFNWIFGVILLGIAGGVTSSIMTADSGKGPTSRAAADATYAKAKRGDDWGQMLALLDDEDAEEIRLRIKQRLLERIESASDEEIESFEQLLSGRDRLKR